MTEPPQSQRGPWPLPGAAARRRRIVAGVGYEPVLALAVPVQIHAAVVPRPVVENRRLVHVDQVDAQSGLLAARGRAPEAAVVADAVAFDRDLAGVLDVDAVPAVADHGVVADKVAGARAADHDAGELVAVSQ